MLPLLLLLLVCVVSHHHHHHRHHHHRRYWEDDSDQFKDGKGSLLPLWRFTSDRTKQKHITFIAWHPT